MKTGKTFSGIKFKLILLSFFSVLVANTTMIVFSTNRLRNGLEEQALDGLHILAESVKASFDNIDGSYSLNANGSLSKGVVTLSDHAERIDSYVQDTDAELALFYGKTVMLTTLTDSKTGERITGTDMNAEVWNTLQQRKVYESPKIDINGSIYIACYVPIVGEDGKVIGSVFAGKPRESIDSYIRQMNIAISGVGVTLLIFFALTGIRTAVKIARSLTSAKETLQKISEGCLNVQVDASVIRRSDEIGDIGRTADTLIQRLREIMQQLLSASSDLLEAGSRLDTMALSTSSTTTEISHAVNDISRGAMSQAEAIDSASQQISSIGSMIEEIANNAENLTKASDHMSEAEIASAKTMQDLSEANDHTSEAIAAIGKQIHLTAEAVHRISEATQLITSVSSQTGLLSLNASIESARAGEAGRGFAVVASEIQKLSIQSNDATQEIRKIIDTLLTESSKTLQEMESTETLMKEQQRKLEDTRAKFDVVSNGIRISRDGTEQIRSSATSCNHAKEAIVDVISSLSSISEENAATSQETNTSMQKLNTTVSNLAEEAGRLRGISNELTKHLEFFRM